MLLPNLYESWWSDFDLTIHADANKNAVRTISRSRFNVSTLKIRFSGSPCTSTDSNAHPEIFKRGGGAAEDNVSAGP